MAYTPKSIQVLSRDQFKNLPVESGVLALRIIDPEDFARTKEAGYDAEFIVGFHDVEMAIGHYTPINQKQAKEIVEFLRQHMNMERFIFRCTHGLSRSHTCALFFAQRILEDEILATRLAAVLGKSINFAVWEALVAALDAS